MVIQTKYCDHCEALVKLTEDGYCTECGKHADNMPNNDDIDMPGGDYDGEDYEDFLKHDIGGEG